MTLNEKWQGNNTSERTPNFGCVHDQVNCEMKQSF